MKNLIVAAVALTLFGSTAAFAQPNYQDRNNQDRNSYSQDRSPPRGENPAESAYKQGYRAGYEAARVKAKYDDRYVSYNGNNQSDRWRQRYTQTYTYNDDSYYRECRNSPDPAGVIAGALIGGLLGNAVGNGGSRTGTTVAGVIVGGVVGATLTKNLDCQDRGYAYKTYYDGFNSGQPNRNYSWYNPSNDHNGQFHVADYYNDADGFRCANYSQTVYIQGRAQEARGRACRQPDGTWAIVG